MLPFWKSRTAKRVQSSPVCCFSDYIFTLLFPLTNTPVGNMSYFLITHPWYSIMVYFCDWCGIFFYWSLVFNATYFSYIMATSFSGESSRSTRKESPPMGKRLVSFITCESSAPFYVIYKSGRELTPYLR